MRSHIIEGVVKIRQLDIGSSSKSEVRVDDRVVDSGQDRDRDRYGDGDGNVVKDVDEDVDKDVHKDVDRYVEKDTLGNGDVTSVKVAIRKAIASVIDNMHTSIFARTFASSVDDNIATTPTSTKIINTTISSGCSKCRDNLRCRRIVIVI